MHILNIRVEHLHNHTSRRGQVNLSDPRGRMPYVASSPHRSRVQSLVVLILAIFVFCRFVGERVQGGGVEQGQVDEARERRAASVFEWSRLNWKENEDIDAEPIKGR